MLCPDSEEEHCSPLDTRQILDLQLAASSGSSGGSHSGLPPSSASDAYARHGSLVGGRLYRSTVTRPCGSRWSQIGGFVRLLLPLPFGETRLYCWCLLGLECWDLELFGLLTPEDPDQPE